MLANLPWNVCPKSKPNCIEEKKEHKVSFLVQLKTFIKPEIKENIVCETFKTIDMAISSNAFLSRPIN